MGYTTDFTGKLKVLEKVSPDFFNYINRFNNVRHMKRNPKIIKALYNTWFLQCFDGELGPEGDFFIMNDNICGQTHDKSIVDYNMPPSNQPGLWCQWKLETVNPLSVDNKEPIEAFLEWDGGEKFYYYIEWLEYMIETFFAPKSYHLSGCLLAIGESSDDARYIVVENNVIQVFEYTLSINEIIYKCPNLESEIREFYKDSKEIFNEWK